ncbi:unnamed protein product [Mytilus coruscus]|uniref:Fibulin C-terminal Ig-like domain-containing protein n=1 Tax=Mytilus coruscus TaxID=42192 RepID=A0A6J8DID3_MYTCO|nr:unnamed protein product [Mytilus coruscus]
MFKLFYENVLICEQQQNFKIEFFYKRGNLLAKDGVVCDRVPCDSNSQDCIYNKTKSVAWQFVALPSLPVLHDAVDVLNIKTNYAYLPTLFLTIIDGNDDKNFVAEANGDTAVLKLVKGVAGPREFKITVKLEYWNYFGTILISVHFIHVHVDISEWDYL